MQQLEITTFKFVAIQKHDISKKNYEINYSRGEMKKK